MPAPTIYDTGLDRDSASPDIDQAEYLAWCHDNDLDPHDATSEADHVEWLEQCALEDAAEARAERMAEARDERDW